MIDRYQSADCQTPDCQTPDCQTPDCQPIGYQAASAVTADAPPLNAADRVAAVPRVSDPNDRPPAGRKSLGALRRKRRESVSGFLLLLVLLVVSGVSLAALAFSDSMLLGNEEVRLMGQRVQARAAVDSGVEAVRLILSFDRQSQADGGGLWDNPLQFQAVSVVPSLDPNQRCNFSILAPGLDPSGQLAGLRYGLQNESARLNLNVLAVIEQQLPGTGRQLLMGLPNMTEDIADAILDWLDEDDEPREFGAEADTYAQLPNPYRPTNGPMQSVEELLLVRGVTPQLLFGLDQNRNGLLDPQETAQVMGMLDMADGGASMLGWAHYLTLHSQEANSRPDGQPRVNINQPDLQQLETELNEVFGNPDWVSFILAYRIYGSAGGAVGGAIPAPGAGGARLPVGDSPQGVSRFGPAGRLVAFQPPPGGQQGGRPGGAGGGQQGGRPGGQQGGGRPGGQQGGGRPGGQGGGGGMMGGGRLQAAPGRPPGGGGQGGAGGGAAQTRPWSSGAAPLDLSQAGSGRFGQVLDLIGGSFTAPDGSGQPVTFTSPFDESPLAMAAYLPQLMQNLTTLSAARIPGRININEAPAPILAGLPGMDEELLQTILEARSDSLGESIRDAFGVDGRDHETWLLTEGLVTLEQMRLLVPLITTTGSVYRAQIVGYFEGSAASSRVDVIVDASSPVPSLVMYRPLDHLGRGFPLPVLGQRFMEAPQGGALGF